MVLGARQSFQFLGGALTFVCLHPSVCPSISPSVAHHFPGTVHHLIMIFGMHM